jgi:hypothetical protein
VQQWARVSTPRVRPAPPSAACAASPGSARSGCRRPAAARPAPHPPPRRAPRRGRSRARREPASRMSPAPQRRPACAQQRSSSAAWCALASHASNAPLKGGQRVGRGDGGRRGGGGGGTAGGRATTAQQRRSNGQRRGELHGRAWRACAAQRRRECAELALARFPFTHPPSCQHGQASPRGRGCSCGHQRARVGGAAPARACASAARVRRLTRRRRLAAAAQRAAAALRRRQEGAARPRGGPHRRHARPGPARAPKRARVPGAPAARLACPAACLRSKAHTARRCVAQDVHPKTLVQHLPAVAGA